MLLKLPAMLAVLSASIQAHPESEMYTLCTAPECLDEFSQELETAFDLLIEAFDEYLFVGVFYNPYLRRMDLIIHLRRIDDRIDSRRLFVQAVQQLSRSYSKGLPFISADFKLEDTVARMIRETTQPVLAIIPDVDYDDGFMDDEDFGYEV
jgi:hypothetical protein